MTTPRLQMDEMRFPMSSYWQAYSSARSAALREEFIPAKQCRLPRRRTQRALRRMRSEESKITE